MVPPPPFKFLAVEELELSTVHPKEIVEQGTDKGEHNYGDYPTDGARRAPAVIDDGNDDPKGYDDVSNGEGGFHVLGCIESTIYFKNYEKQPFWGDGAFFDRGPNLGLSY